MLKSTFLAFSPPPLNTPNVHKTLNIYIISARICQAFFNKNSCNIEIAIVQFVEMHIEPFYHTLIYIIHYY